MSDIILSILTPAVPSRFNVLKTLVDEFTRQIGESPVEHLVLMDNKRRTVGGKRDALLRAARGRYVTFCDDDDIPEPDYVRALLEAAEGLPDVITFRQRVSYNGQDGEVEFKLGNPNDGFKPGVVTKRNAWHVCAWRRELAVLSAFPASNYGEDWQYASRLCAIPNLKEFHIPRILHTYIHSAATTEAPPPLTAGH